MVSSASVTGAKSDFNKKQIDYFSRIKSMKLKTPVIVGFGISNFKTFKTATKYTNGAIIGSAFINYIEKNGIQKINNFIKDILNE